YCTKCGQILLSESIPTKTATLKEFFEGVEGQNWEVVDNLLADTFIHMSPDEKDYNKDTYMEYLSKNAESFRKTGFRYNASNFHEKGNTCSCSVNFAGQHLTYIATFQGNEISKLEWNSIIELPLSQVVTTTDENSLTGSRPDFKHYSVETLQGDLKIKKSGFIRNVYEIRDNNESLFLFAKGSHFNQLGIYFIYLVFFLTSPLFILITPLSPLRNLDIISYILYTFVYGLAIVLALLINNYFKIRRIKVIAIDGSSLGKISGNIFFGRWKISNLSENIEFSLGFDLLGSKGEMETPFGIYILEKYGESVSRVYRKEDDNLCFSISTDESIYIRKNFAINRFRDSEGINPLNPLMTCMVSIIIIERWFKRKSVD
ncbi:MAG: hypothetical protein ACW97W_02685, partial [Candidatus Hodarchaeales archaeon]